MLQTVLNFYLEYKKRAETLIEGFCPYFFCGGKMVSFCI